MVVPQPRPEGQQATEADSQAVEESAPALQVIGPLLLTQVCRAVNARGRHLWCSGSIGGHMIAAPAKGATTRSQLGNLG